MTPIIKAYWKELKKTVEYYQKRDKNIYFDDAKYEEFRETFKDTYDGIKDEYMKESVEALDRHKVAAVMIVVSIETKIISYRTELHEGRCFLGSEMFATEVALSWMLDALNKRLKKLGKKEIASYYMPQAFSCETPYFEIFTRNLFFTNKDYKLSPLDVSEKLFLIEYITLMQNNIDPSIFRN